MSVSLKKENIDLKLAKIGIFSSLLLAIILRSNLQVLMICITLIISCALYLYLWKYTNKMTLKNSENSHFLTFTYSLIFLLISLSLIIFSSRTSLYIRPTGYFLCNALSISLIVMNVVFISSSRKYDILTLLSIILISFSLRLTPQLMYPDLVGVDPWVHREYTNYIINFGNLQKGFAYSGMPAFHLIVGVTSILTGLSYKFSAISSITLSQVLSFSFIFLIGKSVLNPRIGFLGSILLSTLPTFISLGFWIHPTVLGLIISTVLIFLLVKDEKNTVSTKILELILLFVVIITHMQVGLSIAILLTAFLIGKFIYIRLYSPKYVGKIETQFLCLYLILMFSWWMYVSDHFYHFIHLINIALHFDVSPSNEVIVVSQKVSQKLNVGEYIFKLIPFLAYFGLSTIGFLYSVSKRSNSKFFAITLCGLCILLVPLVLSQTKLGGLLGERWLYISQVSLSVAAGAGLFIIFLNFSTKWKQFLLFIFVFLIFFLNILNPASNTDNPILFKNTIEPSAPTEGELNSVYFTASHINAPVYGDVFLCKPLETKFKIKCNRIEPIIIGNEFTKMSGFFLIKPEDFDRNQNIDINNRIFGFMRIYDNSAVRGYMKEN